MPFGIATTEDIAQVEAAMDDRTARIKRLEAVVLDLGARLRAVEGEPSRAALIADKTGLPVESVEAVIAALEASA
jgi:hypothetical protein